MRITRIFLGLSILFILMQTLFSTNVVNHTQTPVYGYTIIKQYPHFPNAFTQGLYLDEHLHLYESAGLYGYSKLIVYDLEKNKILKARPLPKQFFAEGLTVIGNKLYLGLFKAKQILIFDKESLNQIGVITSPVAVWGMTTDGTHLIISDGSENITFFDVASLRISRVIKVHEQKKQMQWVKDINALQFVNDKIFANIWHKDLIAEIDAHSGQVVAWFNLTGLNPDPKLLNGEFVLNGIAYNPKTGTLLVTGKFWPLVYEIQLQGKQMNNKVRHEA